LAHLLRVKCKNAFVPSIRTVAVSEVRKTLKIIPACLLLCLGTLFCFHTYSTYEEPKLVAIEGKFLKSETIKGIKFRTSFHIQLINDPNRQYTIYASRFDKDSFNRNVIYGDLLKMVVSAEDYQNPRNGFGDEYKNQITVYDLKGPKEYYLLQQDAFDEMRRNDKVTVPIIGLLCLVGAIGLILARKHVT